MPRQSLLFRLSAIKLTAQVLQTHADLLDLQNHGINIHHTWHEQCVTKTRAH